jgi:hypothetical protein
MIEDWNWAKNDPKKAAAYFAKGAAPPAAQLKKYADYTYAIAERKPPSGATATLPIQIASIPAPGKTETTSKRDWTFEKEGDAWKIKTAPLP